MVQKYSIDEIQNVFLMMQILIFSLFIENIEKIYHSIEDRDKLSALFPLRYWKHLILGLRRYALDWRFSDHTKFFQPSQGRKWNKIGFV